MSKAKLAARKPVVAQPDEADLPEAWRRRPWVPVLIVVVLVVAVLGAGLLVDRALQPPVTAGLAGCQTST